MSSIEQRVTKLEQEAVTRPYLDERLDALRDELKGDIEVSIKRLDDKINLLDDKLEARFRSLHTLIYRYLLSDDQRDDWNRRNNGL